MAEPIKYISDFGNDNVDKGEENISMDDFTEENIETSGEAETTLKLPRPPEKGSEIKEIEIKKADEFYKSITGLGWNIDRLAPLKYNKNILN